MTLTEEETKKIKEHLFKQLENFPENKRKEMEAQINSMTPSEIETFLDQNNLSHLSGKCIMCSIIDGKTKSFRIGENLQNIAILEITPLSAGHSLIIPKKHSDDISILSKDLATDISKKINEKFSPKEIKQNEIEIMGHNVLEVIPIYGDEKEKAPASEEFLKQIQEKIKTKKEEIIVQTNTATIPTKIPVVKPRIP